MQKSNMGNKTPLLLPILQVSHSSCSEFDCGVDPLNDYFKRYARGNHKKGLSSTFVLLGQGNEVEGFYSLAMGSVEVFDLPPSIEAKLPKYPLPIGRLTRLAVASSSQGKGLGQFLLVDAIERVCIASETVAAYAIIVDAKDLKAKSFFEKYGFISTNRDPLTLYLPLAEFKKKLLR